MPGTAPRPLRLTRRRALAAGLGAAVLPLPFVRAQAGTPIRIGYGVPLSSPYAQEALEMVRGAQAAVSAFNDSGGLHGRKAELLVRDFRLNVHVAASGTAELLKDGVAFMSGGLSPGVMLAINRVTRAHDVIFNGVSQSDLIVAAPAFGPTTFHEGPTPHMSSHVLGDYAYPQYGHRVAFLAVNYAVGHELVNGLKAAGAKYGIKPVAEEYHPIGTSDFTPFLRKIAAAKPTLVFFCNYGPDQQFSIQQASWAGFKKTAKLAVPVISMTARLAVGSDAYEGVIGATSYYWKLEDHIPSANRFNRRFREMNEGRVPTDYAALGYAGPMAILQGVTHADDTATAKVIAAMEAMHYDIYKGPEHYRSCDHQAVQAMYVVESRFTVDASDRDVFRIVRSFKPTETMLATCAAEGHH